MIADVAWWPSADVTTSDDHVTVVTASHNTRELTALLLWSLHRVLDRGPLDVVVIDNGSTDGSVELLADAEAAGLCTLLRNAENLHHGPALNQAFSWLAERPSRPRWVWVLDSDVVIARPDALSVPVSRAHRSGAAIVGEPQWDPWREVDRFQLCSLLVDPARIWRPGIGPFEDSGDPAWPILQSAEAADLTFESFPYSADGYVIHRGRGTLAAVVAIGDDANPLYKWALEHNEPHYGGVTGADETYNALLEAFRQDMPTLDGHALVHACRR